MSWCEIFVCYGAKFLYVKVRSFCVLWVEVLVYSGDMVQSSCTSWGKVLVFCSAKFLHVIV